MKIGKKENFENFKVLNLEKALKSEKYGVWIDANFRKNKKKTEKNSNEKMGLILNRKFFQMYDFF